MLIEMSKGIDSMRFWAASSVTWQSSANRSFGSASFTVPRFSRAFQSPVLDRDGGQLVRIYHGSNVFTGIANAPVWSDAGAAISVLDINEWVQHRILKRPRLHISCPAGIIARNAIRDAFLGSAVLPVTLGPCVQTPPLVPEMRFTGLETCGSVLAKLQDETGQEWWIDHRTYEFRWQMQIGRYHEGMITDHGELFDDVRSRDLKQRAQEAIEVDRRTKRSFSAWNGTVPSLWPSQSSMEV